ncbi:hypothetical protein [Halomicronema hongdechloris]|uniref:hypothetical protein n=1 Tax=Halomicronema hongdechloris TaxID=1209493 RepID=UPI000B4CC91C|nr:hypothetical protein [Halomicronema hongdechloris]
MNRPWTYWLKTTYRRQRLVSIAVTAGMVDVLLGGLDGSPSLAAFGLAMAGGGDGPAGPVFDHRMAVVARTTALSKSS